MRSGGEGTRQEVGAFCRWMPTRCGDTRAPSPSQTLSPFLAILLLATGLLPRLAAAQILADTTDADFTIEALLEDVDETLGDPAPLVERLDELRDHPLNINTATVDDLAQLPALSPTLARTIVRVRTQSGPFATVEALRAVDGMTDATFDAVLPYLTADPSAPVQGSLLHRLFATHQGEWIQRAGRRLDLGRGYADDSTRTTYAGSPDRFYTRLRLRSQHLRFNVTLEKDPGERFAWDPASATYGFDHMTGHLALHDVGPLQTLILGDYVANVGQGVVLWRGTAFGKGRETVRPLARAGEGYLPYGSTDENNFFRGLAVTLRLTPGISTSAFASRRALDATLADGFAAAEERREALRTATSLSQSGLHRTPTERGQKDAVHEDVVGGHLDVQRGPIRLGVVGYHSRFDRPFRPGEAPYQRFLFAGQRATLFGVYADVFLGAVHVFGEAARSPETVGGLGGMTIPLTDRARAVVLARAYPRDFVSLHGYAFGERNGATTNESGYYVGLQIQPTPTWRLAAFFDQYRFPWARFGVARPSTGYEAFFVAEYRPRRYLTVYLQGRSETKEEGRPYTDAQGRRLDAVHPETRQSLRLHGAYRFSPRLRLRARLEAVRFATPDAPDAYGLVLYQDMQWHPFQTLQLNLRLAFFDTDSFETRVFTYEQDLLYTFSVPALAGRGERTYALVQWRPTSRLTLQAKAVVTRYEDAQTVGSGLDETEGHRLREVRAQLRWRF